MNFWNFLTVEISLILKFLCRKNFAKKGFIYDQKKSSSISFLRHFISRSFVNSELKYYFLNRIACWHRCWWRMLEEKCVGDKFQMLVIDFIHWKKSPTHWFCHQYIKSVNIMKSPTSLSPNRFFVRNVPYLSIWRNLHVQHQLLYKLLSRSLLVADIFSFDSVP